MSYLAKLTEEGIYFVTMQKSNTEKDCPYSLRRIEARDDENEKIIVLLTNHLTFGSTTISAIYKDRWQIEIFFKTIKQNLKIKTFVVTSPNAAMIQICTALIAILVLKHLKFRFTSNWSLSSLTVMLRYNLFTYGDLWEWINKPFEIPPIVPDAEQLSLRGI